MRMLILIRIKINVTIVTFLYSCNLDFVGPFTVASFSSLAFVLHSGEGIPGEKEPY